MKSQGHVHELISHLIYSLPHSSNLTECKLVNINGFYSLLQESQLTSFELYFFTSFKIHYKCISNYIIGSQLDIPSYLRSGICRSLLANILNEEQGFTFGAQSDIYSTNVLSAFGIAIRYKECHSYVGMALANNVSGDDPKNYSSLVKKLQGLVYTYANTHTDQKVNIVLGSTIPDLHVYLRDIALRTPHAYLWYDEKSSVDGSRRS